MSEEQIHYRKAFRTPYLSSPDIQEPIILTIKSVRLEPDKTKRTTESFNTAYFEEKEIRPGEILKPMILNAGNCEIIRKFSGSAYINDWNNIAVTIYVDNNVRMGRDIVDGLRISIEQPRVIKPELIPDTNSWDYAIASFRRNGDFELVEAKMFISDENKKLIKVAADAMA